MQISTLFTQLSSYTFARQNWHPNMSSAKKIHEHGTKTHNISPQKWFMTQINGKALARVFVDGGIILNIIPLTT